RFARCSCSADESAPRLSCSDGHPWSSAVPLVGGRQRAKWGKAKTLEGGMAFRDDAQLDTSQVEDRRGGGFGGMGGGGIAVGGGGLGLVVVVVLALLFGVNPFGGSSYEYPAPTGSVGGRAGQPGQYPAGNSSLATNCRSGADANNREDCRVVGFVNSI